MAEPHAPGDGSVEITLAGEARPVVLKCSVDAALTLCRQPGGLENISDAAASTVSSRLLGLDIDTMALIVRLGLGVGLNAVPGLEGQIYRTGLYKMREQLSPFLGRLKNGGEPLSAVAEAGGGDRDEDPQKTKP
jgi:hypothetical protein